MSTLVIFCDVGPAYGVGHLMRCLALGEEFADRGWSVVVAADVASVPFAQAQVDARGFTHQQAPAGVEEHVAVLAQHGADAAVIDSYHVPDEVYAATAALVPTLALVDGDPGPRTALMLLDQNIGAQGDDWPVGDGTVRLAGLDFALMRDEIRSQRPGSPVRADGVPPQVFAFFGGTDAFGAGPVLTEALIATGRPFRLRVVAPVPWSEPPVPGPGQQIELIGPTDRLAAEVLAADLVISASGTSSWELLCLGAGCAFVCVAENQAEGYRRILGEGLGLGLGSIGDLRHGTGAATTVLRTALDDASLRSALRDRAWSRVDGDGRVRAVDGFLRAASDRLG
ncbi:MAG TPA: spore coat protein [Marmoricola sp.]|nr:spore coat protein [Marmoricola sp.]